MPGGFQLPMPVQVNMDPVIIFHLVDRDLIIIVHGRQQGFTDGLFIKGKGLIHMNLPKPGTQ